MTGGHGHRKLSMRMRQMLPRLDAQAGLFSWTDGHTLRALRRRGLVVEVGDRPHYGSWHLTDAGRAAMKDSQ